MFVFTDASKIAMAACVYIGSPSSTNLIIAKSKLPTLKAVTTIPNLEMNALTLGARLAHFTYSSLRASSNVHQILYFSDSENALGWIKAPPDRKAAGVLVANRLEEIRRIVKDLHTQGLQCLFGHIPTAENPADFGTRGFDITSSELWWKGLQLIQGDIPRTPDYQRMFPIHSRESSEDEDTVLHTMVASLAIKKDNKGDERTIFDLTRYNNLHKAQRVVAYALRFIQRTRQNTSQDLQSTSFTKFSTIPSGFELQEAKKAIIRDHQRAFTSSVKLTEDFWNIWSAQYLTSLGEHHKRNIDSRRDTGATPKKGTIVILVDPDQPGNTWNIGRISDIRYEGRSPIRAVTIELPSKRKIRRPINKVIPLEIDADNTISE
ncbi:unnamed protein product [Heligmosomoides polygyrus]|uniref:DUF5641 domain-containing protein n=1 Tax=Heligmosomoides polygyrus TaxID=6339 RepID=A0A183FP50_HELPZ|nr:unnamed protein product [Heligmosomoides polygyrus]